MDSLKGQLAVVTGASSGIGKAIALALAKQGAEVCLVARRREALDGVAREAKANGIRSHVRPADLTLDGDIHTLTQGLQRDFERVDVLILCGGGIFSGTRVQAALPDIVLLFPLNLHSPYAVYPAFLSILRKAAG